MKLRLLPAKKQKKTALQKRQEKNERLKKRIEEGDKRALRKLQISDAKFFAAQIPNTLARLKLAYIRRERNGRTVINKVKISPPVLIHEDYYMLQINTKRLPAGVSVNKLMDEEVLTTLSAAVQEPVQVKFTPKTGLWYVIPRRGGLGIIPEKIEYDAVMELMPKSAPIWAIPIGVGENKRVTWIDLRKVPHMLIVGSTGTGKTVFLKNLVFTLSKNVSPKRINFIIADFKRGPDFKIFANLPHLGAPRPVRYNNRLVIDDELGPEIKRDGDYMDRILIHLDEIQDTLRWAMSEVDRRNAAFDIDITNIDQWNAKHRANPMPHIVIIVDEVGVIMNRLPKKQQDALTMLLADIAMLGRSAGVHLVLGLQKLVSKILDGAISDNMETRIVGRAASGAQSGMALGTGSWAAARLPEVRGRIIWRNNTEELELQTPWVSPQRAVKLLDEIQQQWDNGQDNEDAQAIEIFRWCLQTQNGDYHLDTVFQHFRKQGLTRAQIATIASDYVIHTADDGREIMPVFEVDGVEYVMIPGIPGQRPRRVITRERYNQYLTERELAQSKPKKPAKPQIDPVEVFTVALDELDGALNYRRLYRLMDGKIPVNKIKKIGQEWEGKTVEVAGVTYRLNPPERPGASRILTLVDSRDGDRDSYQTPDPRGTELPTPDTGQNFAETSQKPPAANTSGAEDTAPDWLEEITPTPPPAEPESETSLAAQREIAARLDAWAEDN